MVWTQRWYVTETVSMEHNPAAKTMTPIRARRLAASRAATAHIGAITMSMAR